MYSNKNDLRTDLARVKGHGSAKAGTGHWIAINLTAAFLVPLALWFVWFTVHAVLLPQTEVVALFHNPFHAAMMALFVIVGFYHGQMGLQVVLEDYVHGEKCRIVLLILLKAVALFFGAVALLSLGHMAFAA